MNDGEAALEDLVRALRENTKAQRENTEACANLAKEFGKVLSMEPPQRVPSAATIDLGEAAGNALASLLGGRKRKR